MSDTASLKQTPLNAIHRAAGARMVDFGGWDMPVNYGSQIEEHHAVRNDAGMFDVSHMQVVDFHGARVREFLTRALANNVAKLKVPGKALYSCLLNEQGTVIDDLIAYYFTEDFFRLVVNAGTAEKDVAWFNALNANWGTGLTITPRKDFAMIAVQGPKAREKVWAVMASVRKGTEEMKPFNGFLTDDGGMVARTGYTGEDGFEIVVPTSSVEALWNQLVAAGVRPCGLGARDTLRLEAGMNLYGQDMDETVNPLNAGLAWTVDLQSDRDFVGKAALKANPQTQQFIGLILQEKGGVLRAHQEVITPKGKGEITSGTFSPSMQQSIALARIPLGVDIGSAVQVVIRDKQLAAKVVNLPFVRHGKVLAS